MPSSPAPPRPPASPGTHCRSQGRRWEDRASLRQEHDLPHSLFLNVGHRVKSIVKAGQSQTKQRETWDSNLQPLISRVTDGVRGLALCLPHRHCLSPLS